ncbi:MAG TPA: aminopeptidase P family protein, partial [Myxococcota bacterium]|nr:aminopeptidase P family protein [Myxococcota bacterium]
MSLPFAARRAALHRLTGAPVLLVNNGERPRNLPMNRLPFRSDSSFLYFTGCSQPGAAALIENGACTLFLEAPAPDDALWHGAMPGLAEQAAAVGAEHVAPLEELESACKKHANLLALSVPDADMTALAGRLTGLPLAYPGKNPDKLVDAIIQLRRRRDAWEIAEQRKAAVITTKAHLAAMRGTRVGGHERHVAALFDGVLAAEGATSGYHSIVTVRGEVLHNHHYIHPLQAGDLLLLDGGAEIDSGYSSDVTRTWPVTGRFDGRQAAMYSLCLAAQKWGIEQVRPGTRYRDIHFGCMKIIATGLREEGLLRCSAEEAVETGAVGLFFPHGVGHLLGLDVHDLENFGDRPAYAPGRVRPTQFGARYLRMDLDLEPGIVLTIEPGIYFVPAILHDPALRAEHRDRVHFEKAESFLGFGGIRIEDDVLVTEGAPEVLTAAIPKEIAALEAVVGTGLSAGERFFA